MPVDPLQLLQPALQDRYRIERPLGRGGMALVYLAQDLKHDRQVAIKVLRPELTAMLGRERFLREIRIAARLNHPHVLSLHDSGEANGLLFYVMPFLEGESLLQRLEREHMFSVDEAIRIIREVASALSYAHGRGVLHRDIKPANILLSDGHAVVADFGLARALTRAKTERTITASGLTIGTPAYMSPEQAAGQEDLDPRSDVYSLGCVLYELLGGDPPYVASSPQAILAKHAAAPVPSIRTVRPSVPEQIDKALQRALAKVPADRFGTVAALAAALEVEPEPESHAQEPIRRRAWWALAAAVVVTVAGLTWAAATRFGGGAGGSRGIPADTSRLVVLPPTGIAETGTARDIAQLLQDALTRWAGVSVVDRFQVGDAMARRGNRPLVAAEAERLGRDLGAGRYLRSEVVRAGDSLRLHVGLFEVGKAAALAESQEVLRGDLAGADSMMARVADRLLLRGLGSGGPRADLRGTAVLPAFQAYARGLSEIQEWNLEAADSAFAAALRYDGDYPQPALWLAQVRLWNGAAAARWHPLAEQAVAGRDRLSSVEQPLADGIAALARGDHPKACTTYRLATRREPRRFVAWYGLATCIGADITVIPDRRSPSGWRFRSSYEEAVKAYRQAFLLLPSMHVGFREDGFQRIRDLLFTSRGRLRSGHSLAPDSLTFLAFPSWQGDSLVFVPYPREEIIRGKPEARGRSNQEASIHQRRRFHQIAIGWVDAYPTGADALLALAFSLELLGDRSALDTLRRARQLARDPRQANSVAASEVLLRLKFALPDDVKALEAVRSLADSLLAQAEHPDAANPGSLARLAVLRGRGHLAAGLVARSAAQGGLVIPAPLIRDGSAFWAYAALGGPRDSLERLEKVVEAIIGSAVVPGQEQAEARYDWLSRPASLAYPDVRLSSIDRLGTSRESLAHAQAAAAREEWDEVRRVLEATRTRRVGLLPEDLTFDRLFPEAHLLLTMGDALAASQWIGPTLDAVRMLPPQAMLDVPSVGGLMRAMAFRADVAQRLGDLPTARRWATAIAILWNGADPFLDPILTRMRKIAM